MAKKTNHQKLGDALEQYRGTDRLFSRAGIKEIVQKMYVDFKDGAVLPTDHAEPSAHHKNQCRVCADPRFQLLETAIDGFGRPHAARYKVRSFDTR